MARTEAQVETVTASIAGMGICLPEKILTNDRLSTMLDISTSEIEKKTGIRKRHIVDEEECTSVLATRAAENALSDGGIASEDLGMIIVATITPDYFFPATASIVQANLGAVNAAGFDLSAGCTGFVYGLTMAYQCIENGLYQNVMVIGAETLSRIVDWQDRSTCILFGDGAGAMLLSAKEMKRKLLAARLGSDGNQHDLIMVPGGGSASSTSAQTLARGDHFLKMKGLDLFQYVVPVLCDMVMDTCSDAGVDIEQIDLFIFHQANLRIIKQVSALLEIPINRFFINIERYGNTSCASVPIAMHEAAETGRLKPADLLFIGACGAGMTWGSMILRWE